MKKFSTVIILLLCLSTLIYASGGISGEFGVCSELGSSLSFRVDYEKKGLPTTWDDFEPIRVMKKGTMKHELFRVKAINSFALVPGAPVIQPQTGIPREYPGYRLVFISREGSLTKSAGIGRCALLADPNGENSKQFPVYPLFFPENLAQIILKQIVGFEPEKQPLAFENVEQLAREEKQRKEQMITDLKESLAKQTASGDAQSAATPWNYRELWIGIIALLAVSGVWLLIRKREHS